MEGGSVWRWGFRLRGCVCEAESKMTRWGDGSVMRPSGRGTGQGPLCRHLLPFLVFPLIFLSPLVPWLSPFLPDILVCVFLLCLACHLTRSCYMPYTAGFCLSKYTFSSSLFLLLCFLVEHDVWLKLKGSRIKVVTCSRSTALWKLQGYLRLQWLALCSDIFQQSSGRHVDKMTLDPKWKHGFLWVHGLCNSC